MSLFGHLTWRLREASSDPRAAARQALAAIRQTSGTYSFTVSLISGGVHVETCPKSCTSDHSRDEQGTFVEDLYHVTGEPVEMGADVFDAEEGTITLPTLRAQVQVDPYSSDPRFRVPHVTFEPARDDVREGLTPDEFAGVIAKVRAHIDDKLETVLARVVEARTEWEQQRRNA